MSIIERAREAAEKRKADKYEAARTELLTAVIKVLGPAYHKNYVIEGEVHSLTLSYPADDLRFRLFVGVGLHVEAYDDEEAREYWAEIKSLADLGELTFKREFEAEQAAVRG